MGRRPSLTRRDKGKKFVVEVVNTTKKRRGRPPKAVKLEEREGRHPKKNRISVNAQNSQLTDEESVKVHDNLIKPVDYFNSKVVTNINENAISLLKEKLTEKQLEMFKETCFGYFLDMEHIVWQPQMMHSLLLREVASDNDSELWVRVNGVLLKFSIDEFTLITGLKCNGEASKMNLSGEGTRLINKYFGGAKRVSKQFISECFMAKRWESDEDAVQIAVLFFIHSFLVSTARDRPVSSVDFELIESGLYNDYPWGRDLYDATIESLKERFVGKHHMGDGDKIRKPSMYRLLGFPLAFQVWFYECCPFINGKYAVRKHSKVPRILNWFAAEQPRYKSLQRNLFGVSNKKLKLKNITPTTEERRKLDLTGMFNEEKGKGIHDEMEEEGGEHDKYFSSGLHHTWGSNENISLSASRRLNEGNIRQELATLSARQSEISQQITLLKSYLNTNFGKVFDAISTMSQKLDLGSNVQNVNVFRDVVPMEMAVGAQDGDFGKDVHDGEDNDNTLLDVNVGFNQAVSVQKECEGAKESDHEKHVNDGIVHDDTGVHQDIVADIVVDLPIKENGNENDKSKEDEPQNEVVDAEVTVNDDVYGVNNLFSAETSETQAKSDLCDDSSRNPNGNSGGD